MMLPYLIEIISTASLFAVYYLVFFSVGSVLINHTVKFKGDEERLLVTVLCGALVLAGSSGVIAVAVEGEFGRAAAAWLLLAVLIFRARYALPLFFLISRGALLLQLLSAAGIIFLARSLSPDALVTASSLMQFSGLPIDALIPYNFSRFLVESIPLQAQEVVPGWAATDRGPLAGALIAFQFFLLAAKDTGGWLAPSPQLFTESYYLLVFLNTLPILAVSAALQKMPQSVRYTGLLLLLMLPFFFINVLFPWPKFLAAAFVTAAFLLWQRAQVPLLAGVLLGGALLSHESSLFFVAVMFLLIAVQFLKSHQSADVRRAVLLIAGVTLSYGPWMFIKTAFGPAASSKLFYFHLFCQKDVDPLAVSLSEAFGNYLSTHSITDILTVRIGNLWYPFDVTHPWPEILRYWHAPWHLVQSISQLSFYQLVFVVGVPLFLRALWSALFSRDAEWQGLRTFFCCALLAVLPVGLLFGCPLSSWAHVWAYPAVLAVAILGAARLPAPRWFDRALLFFAVVTALLFSVADIYSKRVVPHPTVGLSQYGVAVVLPLAVAVVLGLCNYYREIKESRDAGNL